ncbi:MAG TPA: hypothetical protein VMM82_05480 [Spirochaetia bacterium]|nr:hypothetical protein [Spirochaetia bacterium]
MRGRVAAVLVLLLSSFVAFAQEAELPFPFVSILRAEPAGYQIKLSWRDSPDTVAGYNVYRSDQEITADTLANARMIGHVDPGVQYFIDTPPDEKSYFYAVLALDKAGKLFSALIPFRNKTLAGVSVSTTATDEELAAKITDIRAVPGSSGDSFEVSFHSSSATRDLLLFRSTGPVMGSEDLLRTGSATQLDAGTTKVDVPALPGVDYWFTVLDAGMFKIGRVPLTAGANTTVDPVRLRGARTALAPASFTRRLLPLPSLEITYGIQSGKPLPGAAASGLPAPKPLSDATQKALAVLLAAVPEPAPVQMERTVLPAEATPSPDKDETSLQKIIAGPFTTGDAPEAQRELLDFMDMRRPPEVLARAHFYLGQSYFFSGKPRDAMLEFLLAEDQYYHDVQAWEDACVGQLEKENQPDP